MSYKKKTKDDEDDDKELKYRQKRRRNVVWFFTWGLLLAGLAVVIIFLARIGLASSDSVARTVININGNATVQALQQLVSQFARTITHKDMQANVELFDDSGGSELKMQRLMTFLTTSSPLTLGDWKTQMETFLLTTRTNYMLLSDVQIQLNTSNNASMSCAGIYNYVFDVPGNSTLLPAVTGTFYMTFRAVLFSTWKLTYAEVMPNATNVYQHNGNTGVQPPGPVLNKRFGFGGLFSAKYSPSLADWTLIKQQQQSLYQYDRAAALSICNTTRYQELYNAYGLLETPFLLCQTAIRDPVRLAGPLVCDPLYPIDFATCLGSSDLNITSGIQTVNMIGPYPVTKDFVIMGSQGIGIMGGPHSLTIINTGVLSLSVDSVPPEFTVASSMPFSGHVAFAFQKVPQPLPGMVWISDPVAFNTVPQFRRLQEVDVPSIALNATYGILPVSRGGTGSSDTLIGGRIMLSTSNQTLVEMYPQLQAGELVTGDGMGGLAITQLVAGIGIIIQQNGSTIEIHANDIDFEYVRSVDLQVPSSLFFTTHGSPITTNGTLAFSLLPQMGGLVFASGTDPNATSVPGFRPLQVSDLPSSIPVSLLSGPSVLPLSLGGTGTSFSSIQGQRFIRSNNAGTALEEAPALLDGQIFVGQTGAQAVPTTIASSTPLTLSFTMGPGSIVGAVTLDLSNAASGVLPVAHGGTGVSSLLPNRVLVSSASGNSVSVAGQLQDGQVLVGITGSGPVPASIIPGDGIALVVGPGHLEIAATGTCNATTKFSQTCLDISGLSCPSGPLHNTCTPAALFPVTLFVQGLTSLGSQTVCDSPIDVNCIPPDGIHLNTLTVGNLVALNFTTVNTMVIDNGTFVADHLFVSNIHLSESMVCEGNATISPTCFPQHLTVDMLTVANTIFTNDMQCLAGPIDQNCIKIDNLACLTPVQDSCMPLRVGTISGIAPNSVTRNFNLQASTGIALNTILNGLSIENTGVVSVSLAAPADIFSVTVTTVNTNTPGTLTFVKQAQLANYVWAGPTTGPSADPVFRRLEVADMPAVPSGSVLIGNGFGMTANNLTAGTGIAIAQGPGYVSISATGLQDITLSVPSALLTVSPSSTITATTGGVFAVSLATQSPRRAFLGPMYPSVTPATPTWRLLDTTDLPFLPQDYILVGTGTGSPLTSMNLTDLLVTSFTLNMPTSLFNVAITDNVPQDVVIDVLFNNQVPGTVFASNGLSLPPSFRFLNYTDLPDYIRTVGLSMPSDLFSVSNSPLTGTGGTLSVSKLPQLANTIFAGPALGGPGVPTFRALQFRDFQSLSLAPGQLIAGTSSGIPTATSLLAGSGIVLTQVDGSITISASNNSEVIGTVTSVCLSAPGTLFSFSPSCITTNGTFTLTPLVQLANKFFGAPDGVNGIPGMRYITLNDLPALSPGQIYYNSGSGNGITTLVAGQDIAITYDSMSNQLSIASQVSVGLALPASVFSVTNSPTSTGTLTGSFIAQAPNQFFASPASGTTPGTPTFRPMAYADLPALLDGQMYIGVTGMAPVPATIAAGFGITVTPGMGTLVISNSLSGTVTSVGLSMPAAIFGVIGSPITGAGTFSVSLQTQAANTVFAGPTTGAAAAPTFRALVANDIPNLDVAKLTTGVLPIARGGTNSGTALVNGRLMVSSGGAIVVAATMNNGQIPIGNGAGYTFNTITAGSGISIANGAGTITISATGGSGTVTNIGLTVPGALLQVTPGSINTAGTFTVTLVSVGQNLVFASPDGSTGTGSFRALVPNDIPNLDTSKLTSGTLPIVRGGTNSANSLVNGRLMVSAAGAIVESAVMNNGQIPIGNGAGYTFNTITAGSGISISNAAGSITISATGGGGGGGGAQDDPDATSCYFEDWVTADSGTGGYLHGSRLNMLETTSGTGATAAPSTVFINSAAGARALGIISLTTGTSSSGRASIMQGSSSLLAGLAAMTFKTRAALQALPTGSENYRGYAGFFDSPGAGEPTDGCYFKIDRSLSTTNWMALCRSNSAQTAVDTGVNIETVNMQVLLIEMNAAGTSVVFKIDGSTVATITTNIASGANRWFDLGYKMEKTNGSTARIMYIDYTQWCITYSGIRG